MPKAHEKIVVITKKTALEELVERFNTRDQARFYLEHLGESFAQYEAAHDLYGRALAHLQKSLPRGVRTQFLERDMVPTYQFAPNDLIVTLGPDGLVVNVAKYLRGQSVVAFNPDPTRIDGVLLPFGIPLAAPVLAAAMRGELHGRRITMAQALLSDGQRILAVNDLFIGANSHVAARYRVNHQSREETQISSGIIVSTGAGSTGWRRSIISGARRLAGLETTETDYRFAPEARQIAFCVREPFESRTSGAQIVAGEIREGRTLEITSQMPQNGVIFGDGVESDYLEFNAGVTASIGVADEVLNLATK